MQIWIFSTVISLNKLSKNTTHTSVIFISLFIYIYYFSQFVWNSFFNHCCCTLVFFSKNIKPKKKKKEREENDRSRKEKRAEHNMMDRRRMRRIMVLFITIDTNSHTDGRQSDKHTPVSHQMIMWPLLVWSDWRRNGSRNHPISAIFLQKLVSATEFLK